MADTPGFCTNPELSEDRLSVIRQIVTSARRKFWFCAQRFSMTRQLRSSESIETASPAGTMVSAKASESASFLPSITRRRR